MQYTTYIDGCQEYWRVSPKTEDTRGAVAEALEAIVSLFGIQPSYQF